MRSLFLKIFLWFWMSVVLISSILVIITVVTDSRSANAEWQNEVFVAALAAHAVDIYEGQGTTALKNYFDHLPKRPLNAYLLDENGIEVLDQKPPQVAIELAGKEGILAYKEADKSFSGLMLGPVAKSAETPKSIPYAPILPPRAVVGPPGPISVGAPKDPRILRPVFVRAEPVVGASGRRYTFLVVIPPLSASTLLTSLSINVLVRLFAVLLFAGVFCFWLARHITCPVLELRKASQKIAIGDLTARASAGMRNRQDEIGVLCRQFDQMAERIESLLADHERLLSTVSHELRSPLTRLSVAAALLRQCPEHEKPEYLNRIELETEQLNRLISQLLALSRIESGIDSAARKVSIDLANLVQEVAADGNFEAQARSCSVTLGAVEPCVTTGIVDQVRAAIENVVRNAIRHTRTDSNVEITMLRQETPAAKVVVQVRDHGPGVPECDLKKIFQPFYRVPVPDAAASDGSGLGLAITERIARAHGGSVRANNAPNGGLVVELEFPLKS